jgi:hypothetical protein
VRRRALSKAGLHEIEHGGLRKVGCEVYEEVAGTRIRRHGADHRVLAKTRLQHGGHMGRTSNPGAVNPHPPGDGGVNDLNRDGLGRRAVGHVMIPLHHSAAL